MAHKTCSQQVKLRRVFQKKHKSIALNRLLREGLCSWFHKTVGHTGSVSNPKSCIWRKTLSKLPEASSDVSYIRAGVLQTLLLGPILKRGGGALRNASMGHWRLEIKGCEVWAPFRYSSIVSYLYIDLSSSISPSMKAQVIMFIWPPRPFEGREGQSTKCALSLGPGLFHIF